MVSAIVSYSLENDARFRAGLDRARAALKDLRLPFALIAADFYRSEQAIFKLSSEGAYPPISDKYGERKQKKVGFKYPLLVYSGALAASVLSNTAPGAIYKVGPQDLIIGTSIKYGIYHQSDDPRSKIPLRKFLFIGPESTIGSSDITGRVGRWLNILNDYVLKSAKI